MRNRRAVLQGAGRRHGNDVRGVAGRERGRRINRAGRQNAGATTEVGLQIAARGGAARNLLVFQRPLLLGAVNQTQIVDAGVLLRGRARAHEVGNGDRGQQTDDGHHNHDFNERKARLAIYFSLHTYVSFFIAA